MGGFNFALIAITPLPHLTPGPRAGCRRADLPRQPQARVRERGLRPQPRHRHQPRHQAVTVSYTSHV